MLKVFAGISMIQGAFFALVGYGLIDSVKSTAMRSGIEAGHPFYEAFRIDETYIYLMVIGGVTVATVAFVWLGLKWTHDAVGAIYHLKKDIEKMKEAKKLHRVKLRDNDYFKDFERSFNEMVAAVDPEAAFERRLGNASDDEEAAKQSAS